MVKSYPENDNISFQPILQRIKRNWYVVLGSIVLAAGLGYMYLKKTPEVFQVTSKMLLENEGADESAMNKLPKEFIKFIEKTNLDDEIGILKSFDLIESTIQELPLGVTYEKKKGIITRKVYADLPFEIVVDSSHFQTIYLPIQVSRTGNPGEYHLTAEGDEGAVYDTEKDEIVRLLGDVVLDEVIRIGDTLETNFLKFSIIEKPEMPWQEGFEYSFYMNSLYDLAQEYAGTLDVTSLAEKSKMVELSLQGEMVDQVKAFLNKLMEIYTRRENNQRIQKAELTLSSIDDQLTTINDSLSQLQDALTSYKTSVRIMDPNSQAQILNTEKLQLEKELRDVELKVQVYEYVNQTIASTDEDTPISMPSNAGVDATMQSQLIRLAEAQRQKEIQAMDQLEGNPLLQQKVLEVRNLRRGLVDHATRNLESAKITQASLNNRLAFTRGKIAALPSQNSRLENMTSDTKSVQEIATELEKEKRETSIAMAGLFKADYVVDEARLASRKPVAPNKIFVYGIVFVLGLGLPLSVLIGLEFLQMRVVKQQDIESSTTIPVLGTIVRSEKEVKVVNQETANSLLAESLRSIRVQFQYSVADDTRKVIGITSTRSGEGKSFCSANLSSTFALSGKRTLIIDLDLRKPDQMNYFQYDNSEGIFAYLNQGGDYRKLIQKTGVSNLDILPSGPPFFNPLDLIDSHKERLALLIEMLRSEYDYIILDTPPIGQASDYFILKQFVDFTVFVVRHNLTEITSLIRINELYETGQITDIAIAINDVKADSNYGYGRHNYGYGYGYAMQKK